MLLACPCFAQKPQLIQSWACSVATCALKSNATAGHTLIVTLGWYFSSNAISFTDTQSLTFTQKYYDYNTHEANIGQAIYTATLGNGAESVTATISGSSNLAVHVEEWDLGGISLTTDGSQTIGHDSVLTLQTPNLATTYNGDLLISICNSGGGQFALIPPDINITFAQTGSAFRIAGAPGNYTSTCRAYTSSNLLVAQVAFAPTSGSSITIISPATLPTAITSDAYNYTLEAQGGTSTLTWTITSGALPLGLSLSSAGVITGTPTNSAFGAVTIQASDGTHTASQAFTINVGTTRSTIVHVQDSDSSDVFSTNVTAGNLIILPRFTVASGKYGVPICTDGLGTNYVFRTAIGNVNTGLTVIYTGIAPSTGAVTITCPATTGTSMAAVEFSGVQTFYDFEALTLGTANPVTSASFTTPSVNSLIYGAALDASGIMSASTPCTAISFSTNTGTCYELATTVTGYTETFTNSTSDIWETVLIGLRPSVTGTAPTPSGNSGSAQVY